VELDWDDKPSVAPILHGPLANRKSAMEDRHVCRLAVYSTGRALATYERDHWHVGPTRQRAVGVSSLPCGPLTAWSAHNRHAVTNHLMHGCTHYRREAIRQRSKTRPGRPAIMRGSTGCPRQQKSGLCAVSPRGWGGLQGLRTISLESRRERPRRGLSCRRPSPPGESAARSTAHTVRPGPLAEGGARILALTLRRQ